ncbi:hypothetical protein, partial [Hypericibacter sp.]|uniref:hypothetical protein n=1 Tax=Hypericibacter sp. TaxID=2705401 RepID=UPI003D6D201B
RTYLVASIFLVIAVTALPFWKVPDYAFGKLLKRIRHNGFRRMAVRLGVEFDPKFLDIDWDSGTRERHD